MRQPPCVRQPLFETSEKTDSTIKQIFRVSVRLVTAQAALSEISADFSFLIEKRSIWEVQTFMSKTAEIYRKPQEGTGNRRLSFVRLGSMNRPLKSTPSWC